jgi:hypothetical protein
MVFRGEEQGGFQDHERRVGRVDGNFVSQSTVPRSNVFRREVLNADPSKEVQRLCGRCFADPRPDRGSALT